MTAATFKGTYSDWKLIRSRGVVQVVIEIPIEGADAAYQAVGGMPNPAKEVWLAVARLDPAKVQAEPDKPKEHRKFSELSPTQQAGIACADPVFQRFLDENYDFRVGSEADAVDGVHNICGIASRKEILPGSAAAGVWHALYDKFLAWKQAA